MLTRFKRLLKRKKQHIITPVFPEYDFGGVQQTYEFVHSPAKIKALFGGNKAAKTHTNVYRQIKKIRENKNLVCWAATETAELVGSTLWPKYQELTATGEILYDDIGWANSKQNIPAYVPWWNGTVLRFKTYAQGRKAFQSTDIHDALFDEEPADIQIYKETLPRLAKYNGQLGLSMTPLLGKSWPYYEIDQNNIPGLKESWRISLFDNPFLDQRIKDELIQLYGIDEIDRRVYGLFVIVEGAVFKEFNDKIHILQDFPTIPPSWRIVRSFDLGYRNPFVCLWGALSPDDTLFVYGEYYVKESLISEHAYALREQEKQFDVDGVTEIDFEAFVECSVSDHEAQTRAELDAVGIYTIPAIKQRELSWQIANRKFKARKIFLAPWLTHLPDEIQSYHFKPNRTGGEVKEEPVKVNDHSVDAFLYMIMYFWGEGETDLNMLTA